MADHGTRTRYNQGCSDGVDGGACEPCVKANRDYYKGYTQKRKGKGDAAAKLAAAPEPTDEPGPMEQAVLDVVETLPMAQRRPDLVAAAKAMARILDNPLYVAQQTNALKQYRDTMDQLMKGSERKGKLASVRAMTQPKTQAG